MSFDTILKQMTAGFGQTCLIFFFTLLFSLPLGMFVYFGKVSRHKLGMLIHVSSPVDNSSVYPLPVPLL